MKKLAIVLGMLALAGSAFASDAKKYDIKVPAVTAKAGQKSDATLKIEAAAGSHVSDEAPLKIILKGDGVKLEKEKLTTADIAEGKGASPTFKITFTAEKAGAQKIEAQATFIVCTKELCEREQETVNIPVDVK